MKSKIYFIVLTKDNPNDALKTIASVNVSNEYAKNSIEAVVVDKHSSKKTKEEYAMNFFKYDIFKKLTVSLVCIGKNCSDLKAFNIGLKSVLNRKEKSSYVCVLTDEMRISRKWIEHCLKEFEEDSELSFLLNGNDGCYSLYASMLDISKLKEIGLLDDNLASFGCAEKEYLRRIEEANVKTKKLPSEILKIIEDKDNPDKFKKDKALTEEFEKLYSLLDKSKKKVIYTFIEDKESIPSLRKFDSNIEYVCFCKKDFSKKGWTVFNASKMLECLGLNDSKVEKTFFKLFPHFFFYEKDISIWADESVLRNTVDVDFSTAEKLLAEDAHLVAAESSKFKCLYEALVDAKLHKTISEEKFNQIVQLAKWHVFQPKAGFIDSSVLIRRHNAAKSLEAMEKLWSFINMYQADECYFFNLVLSILKTKYSYVPSKSLMKIFQ